jgi:hypothetical protein
MNYTKPEVLAFGQAIDAVRATGTSKGSGDIDTESERTGSAYEADE